MGTGRNGGGKSKAIFTPEEDACFVERYLAGEPYTVLARERHQTDRAARQMLVDNGVPIRLAGGQRGEKSPRWTGGRFQVGKDGYVRVLVDPADPIAGPMVSKNQRNYLPEHRLIMARHLGRSLTPKENVHHKNGAKNDNRIENLELWVTTQPAGQRVQDLGLWAVALLQTYYPEMLDSTQSLDKVVPVP